MTLNKGVICKIKKVGCGIIRTDLYSVAIAMTTVFGFKPCFSEGACIVQEFLKDFFNVSHLFWKKTGCSTLQRGGSGHSDGTLEWYC